jgi:CBS domain containing-hemolysin-like protein
LHRISIPRLSTIPEAISHMCQERLGSALVKDELGEIVGIVTARDLLRFIRDRDLLHPNDGTGTGTGTEGGLPVLQLQLLRVEQAMTPKERLVYCSPTDSVRRCQEIMFQCKVRSLPVVHTHTHTHTHTNRSTTD